MTQTTVNLYGTDWCGLTTGFKKYLDARGIEFEYYNVESAPEIEQRVREMNGGKLKFPMVVVGDRVMKNPPPEELNEALQAHNLPIPAGNSAGGHSA